MVETWKCSGCGRSAPGITVKNSSALSKLTLADVELASGKDKEQLGAPGYEIMRKCASCGAPFCIPCINSKMKEDRLWGYDRATCPSCGNKFGLGAVLVYFKGLDDELNPTPLAIPPDQVGVNEGKGMTVRREWMERIEAAVKAKPKSDSEISVLLHDLKDKDWWVRKKAAERFAEIKDKKGVEPLIQRLRMKTCGLAEEQQKLLGK